MDGQSIYYALAPGHSSLRCARSAMVLKRMSASPFAVPVPVPVPAVPPVPIGGPFASHSPAHGAYLKANRAPNGVVHAANVVLPMCLPMMPEWLYYSFHRSSEQE